MRADAIEPPPQVGAGGRRDFQAYHDAATHRAFAVTVAGACAWRTAQATREAAINAAPQRCRSLGGEPCRLHAVDDAYAAD